MTIFPSGAGALPRRVPRSVVRSDLRAVLAAPGPYVSIYLDLAATSPAERTERILAVLDGEYEPSGPCRNAIEAVLNDDLSLRDRDVSLLAVVVAADGATVNPDELRAWVTSQLRSSRAPALIEVRDELPYNDTGKVLRRVLKAELS